jgi:hypothetical protein
MADYGLRFPRRNSRANTTLFFIPPQVVELGAMHLAYAADRIIISHVGSWLCLLETLGNLLGTV